ncbi:sulfatase family protein [Paludisphaera mucosa]|uniref:Sulfatase-like hydrolase/transferase n=1 Tax=Paludisphaera mucosa TaxID=3030827 RepID=A0ABT6FIQ1_9BACT|nr:sulfatase-like hydrolase/transferase [Paludisphaera mucosa]MDG3007455.1 sulfatase-like hydrolase/transferase [Paludisphaera mucosa]
MTGLSVLAIVAGLVLASDAPEADVRPNIVVVYADDMGYTDLGCYGGDLAKTPNLDRMAREGVRLTRYYSASPICSPSRCGLLTGQFPARWRITSYLQTRAGNRACGQADFLDPAAPSLPRTLKSAGYATAHVGKWHLGGGRDVVDPPKFAAYGYDVGLGTWESPEPHPDITATDWIWSDRDPVKRWDRTRWMVDRTLDFLKGHADRPCFVNLWLDDPHTPWVPSAEDQAAGKEGRTVGKASTPGRLRGVLEEVDRQVGRLLDAVRAGGSARPTLVLFLSDNGPLPTLDRRRSGVFRGSKLSLYEGGVRLPFLAWGPGLVPSGVTNTATVLSAVDLFPTLCALAGAPLRPGYESDGENLLSVLRGERPRRAKPLFWEYGRNPSSFDYPPGDDRSPNVAILDGDWKLLVNADGTGAELYDLALDPEERHDRAAAEPALARRLADQALAWRRAMP